jgi:FtsP/CotA-like multicopper oxidase with cupredoxin domain
MRLKKLTALLALIAIAACSGGGGGASSAIPSLASSAGGGAIASNAPGSAATPDATTPGAPLIDPPIVSSVNGVAAFTLTAMIDARTGLPAFVYNGQTGVAPTIDVKPGDTIKLDVINALGGGDASHDMNLHFHGMEVSPEAPSDDVLTLLAMPGGTLHYVVQIPKDHEPGLDWYHPHVMGETDFQVGMSGMSGAIIVEGMQQHIPALAKMPQHVLVVRDVEPSLAAIAAQRARAAMAMPMDSSMSGMAMRPADTDTNSNPCGPDDEGVQITVDGSVRPTVTALPNQSVFLRVVNAVGHRTLDLKFDSSPLQVVATDGVPNDALPSQPVSYTTNDIVIPPAARAEFVVTMPRSGSTVLRTLCYNSGPGGDPDDAEILATFRPPAGAKPVASAPPLRVGTPVPAQNPASQPIPYAIARRVVRLSEDSNGFYINGAAFNPKAPPLFVVHTGTVESWTVVNITEEVHAFHTHQVHFLVQQIDGKPVAHPRWQDTAVVPPRLANGTAWVAGTLQMLVDFRDPVIRGTFMFHCHILDHEDAGMMAKIQAI